jgi:hypothetical protein
VAGALASLKHPLPKVAAGDNSIMAIAWKVCNLLVNRKIGLWLRGLDTKDPQGHNTYGAGSGN